MTSVQFDGRLILRPQFQAPAAAFTPGPGRILTGLYSSAGASLGNVAGRLSHKMGLGPEAAASRIYKSIEESHQAMLDELHATFMVGRSKGTSRRMRGLQKSCMKLMEYARPSESPTTQLQTFKHLISLITRYPGLRLVFVQHLDIQRVREISEEIAGLWARPQDEYANEPDYVFFWRFAAFCLSRNALAVKVEEVKPSNLGRLSANERSVVETLISCCKEDSGPSRLTATRYLGNILGVSSFWNDNDIPFLRSFVVEQLLYVATQLVEDIGIVSCDGDTNVEPNSQVDPDGVDLLTDTTLAGLQRRIQKDTVRDLNPERWFNVFIKLVDLCRNPYAEFILPLSWTRAGIDWHALFIEYVDGPVPGQLPGAAEYDEVSELVEVEVEAGTFPNLTFLRPSGADTTEQPESEPPPIIISPYPYPGPSGLNSTPRPPSNASELTNMDEIILPTSELATSPYPERAIDGDTLFSETQTGSRRGGGLFSLSRMRRLLLSRRLQSSPDASRDSSAPVIHIGSPFDGTNDGRNLGPVIIRIPSEERDEAQGYSIGDHPSLDEFPSPVRSPATSFIRSSSEQSVPSIVIEPSDSFVSLLRYPTSPTVDVPPDGYIPVVDADTGAISLPPPHELVT